MSCHESSSSSSSSCSPCQKKCCSTECSLKSCNISLPEPKSAAKVACEKGDAVVTVVGQYIFLSGSGATATVAPATDSTPLSPGGRVDFFIRGNGSILKNGWILTTASVVFAPPSFSGLATRYPFQDPANTNVGQIRDQMIRASQILVDVNNVNNTGKSYTYVADVVAVNGAADIALLSLRYPCCNGTKSAPKLKVKGKDACHPHIALAKSCYCVKRGEDAFVLGSYNSTSNALYGASFNALLEGKVSSPNYLDPWGNVLYEQLLVDVSVAYPNVGSPILNGQGHLIAMQTTNEALSTQSFGNGSVGGVKLGLIRRTLKLAQEACKASRCDDLCHIESIRDPAGPYYRVLKGYLGVAYELYPPADNTYSVDYTSGSSWTFGAPRMRIGADGELVALDRDSRAEGVQVIGLAGLNPADALGVSGGYWYVPGGTGAAPLVSYLQPSPLIGRITTGDRLLTITKCNGKKSKKIKLGGEQGQYAPSELLWRLSAGDDVELSYETTGQYVSNTGSNALPEPQCCTSCRTTKVSVMNYPAVLDWPWYSLILYPNLAADYSFASLNGQNIAEQTPALATGADFHASV